MAPSLIVPVLMRFLHIGSVVVLIGSIFYARFALKPAIEAVSGEPRRQLAAGIQARFRTWVLVMLLFILGSGMYQLLAGPKHTASWHMWFGIKILLVLHILVVSVLWATSPYGDIAIDGKGKNRTTSLAIVGIITILVSTMLRTLSWMGR